MRPAPALVGRCLLLASPLLLPLVLPSGLFPAGLAYAVSGGWWLIAAGVVAAVISIASRTGAGPRLRLWAPVERVVERPSRRTGRLALTAALLTAGVLLIPGYRWGALRFSGDEPKYVRMAVSLHADLDVAAH